MVFWSAVWPYLVGALVLGGAGVAAWWLRRTDREVRERDHLWRQADRVENGLRTLAEMDALTGTEFEEQVAALCRRNGAGSRRRLLC
ncbi:hypothetical protein [Streptomyces sp. NPDC048411]|uniref:hypothetical protein n=1 Tax=Streptomyces sp. NPDC048411 TaxID=3157206 RepID=UPI00345612E7